jgi:adenylate cyclase
VEDFEYGETVFQLEPGDVLCMVTDGITEAMNAQGELYGTARLATLIEALAREPGEMTPERIGTAVREEIARFCGAAEPADDVAILAVRWNG